jgi:uncharacterized protein (DUF885 family)
LLTLLATTPAIAQQSADDQLNKLLTDAWETELREFPLFATRAGDHRYDDRLDDMTVAAFERRLGQQREFLTRLEKIDRGQLSPSQQINYDLFGRVTREHIREYEFGGHLMPITNRSGFHVELPELPRHVPLNNLKDYENYVARLQSVGRYADEHIELMREGIRRGMTLADVSLRDYRAVIDPQLVTHPTKSRLYDPFRKLPGSIHKDDARRLDEAARRAITESVVPGLRRFETFLGNEYLKACRGQIGASSLPNGREFYRFRVRKFTTLDVTPEQVHETGLAEVKRIRGEMDAIIGKLDFRGDFAAFVNDLRTNPKFYPNSADELMKDVSYVLKKMDGQLPRLFKTLPRSPYGIRPVPEHIAPQTTTAYYWPPPGDGSQAGFYYVNTYNLKSRPLFEIEALSLHEAVPGHHLQLALQQELGDLPPFRRFAHWTAFIEGWGLYAERLGLEVGFYEDPYSDFGRLSYEMWRACRLVVDTGMHHLGWSRQQAIDFMAANTALSLHNITSEVDRYIAWPGQALAYKMGELKIRQLRQVAEELLGDRFDVREFHEVVLGAGALPLDVLDARVQAWIKAETSRQGN